MNDIIKRQISRLHHNKLKLIIMATDEQIKQRIVEELFWDSRIDDSKINVSVDGGIVRLKGEVPSCSQMFNAENNAWNIPGVIGVNNELFVVLTETPLDDEILNAIENILNWIPFIDSSKIEISMDGGLVTLEGSVDAYWKKIRIENIIFDVKGVNQISNKLSIVPTQDFIDERIANNIVSAIDRNLNVDAELIDVKVENGVVTISGNVPTFTAYQAAYNAAAYTSGVIDIIDNITIGIP